MIMIIIIIGETKYVDNYEWMNQQTRVQFADTHSRPSSYQTKDDQLKSTSWLVAWSCINFKLDNNNNNNNDIV